MQIYFFEWNSHKLVEKYMTNDGLILQTILFRNLSVSRHTWTNCIRWCAWRSWLKKKKSKTFEKKNFYEMEARIETQTRTLVWTLNYGKIIEWTPEVTINDVWYIKILRLENKLLNYPIKTNFKCTLWTFTIGISLNWSHLGKIRRR
jgi:hypothetical protein